MARPALDERFRRSKLQKYLLADETVIVAQRRHWAIVAEPIATAVVGFIVVVVLNLVLPASFLTDLLWWAALALAARALWKYLMWRREWLLATNKRLMVNYGLIHQGVAMFSLSRVPDLTYTRSSLGQLLGYGTLLREGTGAGQTLHEVRFVDQPHATYTTICAAIFELQDRMFGMDDDEAGHDHRFEDGPPPHTPGLYADYVPAQGGTGPADSPVKQRDEHLEPGEPGNADESDEDSAVIRIRYGGPQKHHQEPWRPSPDMDDSAIRDADTGPIPYRRSATDEGDGWASTTNDPDR